MIMTLTRFMHTNDRIYGKLEVKDEVFSTLELPWKDNKRNISCIPVGKYKVKYRSSRSKGKHLILLDVPNRDLILIHSGNYPKDTQGCILIGKSFKDINNDNKSEVYQSKEAMRELFGILPRSEPIEIEIRDYSDD